MCYEETRSHSGKFNVCGLYFIEELGLYVGCKIRISQYSHSVSVCELNMASMTS